MDGMLNRGCGVCPVEATHLFSRIIISRVKMHKMCDAYLVKWYRRVIDG